MALRRFAAAAAGAVAAGSAVAYADDIKAGVGFDPEALERGAKALREINKSPYARKVRTAAYRSDLQCPSALLLTPCC